MPTPKTQEEMLAEIHATLFDPEKRAMSAADGRRLRDEVVGVQHRVETWQVVHDDKDDVRHRQLLDNIAATNGAVREVSARVEKLETKRTMTPGEMHAVRSIMPPPGKPGDTGSYKVDQDWLADVEAKLADLHTANEKSDQEKKLAQFDARLAQERQRGAEEATARARAEAESQRQAAEAKRLADEARRVADLAEAKRRADEEMADAEKARADAREKLRLRLAVWGGIATFLSLTLAYATFYLGQSQRTPHHDAPSTVTAPAH